MTTGTACHISSSAGTPGAVVDAWLAAFNDRWPTHDEVRALVTADVVFVERPNLVNPGGSARDLAGILAGVDAGGALLRWQRYEVRDHIVAGSDVVTRMRWVGELAIDAGPWSAGTVLKAWCVAHYHLDGARIERIEQHDCYEPTTGA